MMLQAALRDLIWRRRRYLIAAIGTALVFAMTLVLTGLSNGFDVEAKDTLESFGAGAWVVKEGAAGPFLGAAPFSEDVVAEVADTPGVESAGGLVFGRKSVGEGSALEDVNVFGFEPDGPGMPEPDDGRVPEREGEVMVSTTLGFDIGETMDLSGTPLEVVGEIRDSTVLAGVGNTFLTISQAQAVVFSGAPIVSAVVVDGELTNPPSGYVALDDDTAMDDFLRPLEQPRQSITFMAIILWLIAALIIGSVVYISTLERVRDFAVFKALGIPVSKVLVGLAFQAAVLALIAAVVGIGLALLLAPVFPMKNVIPMSAFVALPIVGIVIGALASVIGMRRVMTVDPALAFGGP